MTALTPERSLAQRRDALGRANEIRSKRAALKRELKAGRGKSVHELLVDPPEWLETAKVFNLLLAVPKYGRVKVSKLLQIARISPSKTVIGLSARQCADLVSLLRPGPGRSGRSHNPLGTAPDAQHMQALNMANAKRLAIAAVKDAVANGETTVPDVLREIPPFVDSMTIGTLLMAQHRWGRSRTTRLLRGLDIREDKPLTGTPFGLTQRQRDLIAERLEGVRDDA